MARIAVALLAVACLGSALAAPMCVVKAAIDSKRSNLKLSGKVRDQSQLCRGCRSPAVRHRPACPQLLNWRVSSAWDTLGAVTPDAAAVGRGLPWSFLGSPTPRQAPSMHAPKHPAPSPRRSRRPSRAPLIPPTTVSGPGGVAADLGCWLHATNPRCPSIITLCLLTPPQEAHPTRTSALDRRPRSVGHRLRLHQPAAG